MFAREITLKLHLLIGLITTPLLTAVCWVAITHHAAVTLQAEEDRCKRDYRFLHAYTEDLDSINDVMEAVPKSGEIRRLTANVAGTKIGILAMLAQDKAQHDLVDVMKAQIGIYVQCEGHSAVSCMARASDLENRSKAPWNAVEKATGHCDRFNLP